MKIGSWVMIGGKQVAIVTGAKDGTFLVHPVNAKGETLMVFSESLQRMVTDERQVDSSALRLAEVSEIPASRRLREVR